jgi:hypothetical protein
LQDVGDADARLEGVGGVGVAEVMREDAFADEAGDTAQQDTGRDQPRQVGAQARGEQPAGGGIRCRGGMRCGMRLWRRLLVVRAGYDVEARSFGASR